MYSLLLGVGLVGVLSIFFVYREISESLSFAPLNRVNVGVWGKHTLIVSISKNSNQHYIIPLPADMSVEIPGGLKEYRVGALGKLAQLESDPKLFSKALGMGAGVFLHKTLYESGSEIYYEDSDADTITLETALRELKGSAFRKGDMNLFDRISFYYTVSKLNPSNTTLVRSPLNSTQVVLFDKTFRNERKLVQMLYAKSQRTAILLAKILENTGIRVADIAGREAGKGSGRECFVVEKGEAFSYTARFIAQYFSCVLEHGETGLYEIQWILGSDVEQKWKL